MSGNENVAAQAREVFLAAIEKPAEERAIFLDEICRGNATLRRAVERLLNSHAELGSVQPTLMREGHSKQQEDDAGGRIQRSEEASQTPTEIVNRSLESTRRRPPSPAEEKLPDRIGEYRILNLIAIHGQGAVYRADHPHLNRQVVIKVSKHALGESRQQEVVNEGKTLAGLSHPNLAQVYDLQFENGRPYLVMEYIEGRNLEDAFKDGRFPPGEAAQLIATLAEAIQYAHDKGVVHHDLKPANVMIQAFDGVAKIIDFGLAQADSGYATAEGSRMYGGTIAYMAPEQAQLLISGGSDGERDERVDVFSLGAVLFEMLTGERLFQFSSVVEGLQLAAACKIDTRKLKDAKNAAGLRDVCLKALAADPKDRYRTAGDFAKALRNAIDKPSLFKLPVLVAVSLGATMVLVLAWLLPTMLEPGSDEARSGTELNSNGNTSSPKANSEAVDQSTRPGEVLRGVKFTHYALTDNGDVPGPLFQNGAVRENDGLRIDANFKTPLYCYLIAMNPDGVIQLCHPADGDQPQSQPSQQLRFPQEAADSFGFTDGAGQQAFVVVQSQKPLPAFNSWSANIESLVATALEVRGRWIWEEDLPRLWEAKPTERGRERRLTGGAAFERLLRGIASETLDAQVRAVSFPVVER